MHLIVLPVYQCLQNSKGALCPIVLMSIEDALLRQPSDLMFLLHLLAEKIQCSLGYEHFLCCSAIMPLSDELSILTFLKHSCDVLFYEYSM